MQSKLKRLLALFALVLAALSPMLVDGQQPIDANLRERFKLDDFYQRVLLVDQFPIVGSAAVSEAALREAAWIVRQMTSFRPELRQALADSKTRMAVMAHSEYTTDIPEHARLKPRIFWDRRARGLGATPSAPAVSCGEENLLCFDGDPYWNENICIHEFAHAIHLMALRNIDPTFQADLQRAFQAAKDDGLWKGTYAITEVSEYFAEGVQSWFDNNRQNDALHNHVNTRQELREYDPALAVLCERVFGDLPWRYQKPSLRAAADREHLGAYPNAPSPKFQWRKESLGERPLVLIQTSLGDIEVELDAKAAPLTVANFIYYVHEGLLADGEFFRVVRQDNQASDAVTIAVVQGKANELKQAQFLAPIPIERTSQTGLKHRDGTLSMAREAPDSGQHHFFFCIGDQPELDYAGRRNPDGQGFAAFGQVTKGMDIIKKIHKLPTQSHNPQLLVEPVKIQRAIRRR